jgi:hypothetical protein
MRNGYQRLLTVKVSVGSDAARIACVNRFLHAVPRLYVWKLVLGTSACGYDYSNDYCDSESAAFTLVQ